MKTYQCPKCELDFFDGRYCRTCGTILIPKPAVICSCGFDIYKNDTYCKWCGKFIGRDTRELPEWYSDVA